MRTKFLLPVTVLAVLLLTVLLVSCKGETVCIHEFGHWVTDEAPTCTEDGVEGGMCTRCQKQATNVLYAKGHAMSDAVTVKEATCTENGLKEGVCSVCGEKTQEAIEAKGHAYGEFVVTKERFEDIK